MNLNRKSLLSFIVALCFAVACQPEEEIAPSETTDFVAGELATVLIAKDHQVTFFEGAPGAIVVSELKSMEADQKASPEIQKSCGVIVTWRCTNSLRAKHRIRQR